MEQTRKLNLVLFLLRISVFCVFLVWTLDKFIAPEHAARVYGKFYFLPGIESQLFYAIGAIQLIIILCFVAGYKKFLSTGLVLIMHAVSTFSSYNQYIGVYQPGVSLLFWAAWPMLAACFAVFYLRDQDTLFSMNVD